ncbi:MAG TPA: hypothetical protein VFG07_04400 [Thermoplasmata archaeon]|nr:hypothetical protein [Thermoplasmata archaeon]
MADKDDYDRAWARYVNARAQGEQTDPHRTRIRRATLLSGVILLGLGSIISALGNETLSVYNACFADPACFPSSSELPFGEFFGVLAIGIILIFVGAVLLAVNLRRESTQRVTRPTD